MKKLNVCLVNDSFPPAIDGVANAVVNYGRYINEQHGSASVVTPYYPEADDSVYNYPIIRYPSLDVTKLVGYRAGLPFSPEIQSQIEQSGFDIIHSHCPIASTMLARAIQPRLNIPVVMTYHTKFDIDIANAIKGKLLQEEATRLLVQNIEACDEVWTVSRGAGENLKSLGYRGDYIVMPNGVDFPVGRVDDDRIEQVTEGYDLPHNIPVYLFVGRMMWYKGIRITLDALNLLKAAGKDFRMVFIGKGNDKDEIIDYAQSLGLCDKVFFLPPIYDREIIRAWYCRADLFLFPSTFDTNGLVVREAAACGLASVLVKGSCAAEDSTDGVDGFLIDENAFSMAQVLTILGDNTEKMKEVGQQAQKNLYMSWEESVRNAYERYGIVIEKYNAGEYKKKKELTDEFYKALSNGMAEYTKARQRRKNFALEVVKQLDGVKNDFENEKMRIRTQLDLLRDKAETDIIESRELFRESIEEISEYIDMYFDRFH